MVEIPMKRIRKAVLTGGGRATRLHPITTTINKHLIPLANKPIIFRAIEKAVEAGVEQIYINTNPGETSLQENIGDGAHWGIRITYFEQTGGPQGVPHVAKVAERFIGDDPFLFYFSDNVLLGSLKDLFDEFHANKYDCMLAFSQVPNPDQFGIPRFGEDGRIIEILEKPKDPPNNLAQTGIMLYGPKVFYEAFDNIEKSARGEYEISHINSYLLKHKKVGHKEITGWWKDTGLPEDMLTASRLLMEHMHESEFPCDSTPHTEANMQGKVHVGVGCDIGMGAHLIGPVIIGENCIVEQATIGPNVTLGSGSVVKNAHIENSIVLENTTITAPIRIRDSIIGKNAKLIKKQQEHTDGHRMIVADKTVIEM